MQSQKVQLTVLLAVILIATYFIAQSDDPAPGTGETPISPTIERVETPSTTAEASAAFDVGAATVRFPDGFEFDVQFRDRPPKAPLDYWPPGVSFAHVYAGLVEMAENGDMHAAATLYYGAKGCRQTYYDTEQKLQDGRNTLLETNTIKRIDPDTGRVSVDEVDSDSVEIMLLFIEQQYKRCRWVTDEMKDEMEHWKDRAVELGNPDILRELATYAPNTASSRQTLLDLFLAGDYKIGRELGTFLMGNRTPYASDTGTPPGDLWQMQVDGYAYFYLARLLMEADPTAPRSARWRRAMDEEFKYVVSNLSPAARQAGTERAKEILESYSFCCQSMGDLSRVKN